MFEPGKDIGVSSAACVMQCRARRVHPYSSDFFIRCTQPDGHDGPHALEEQDADDELLVWTDVSPYALPPDTVEVAHG